jgi:hypothetical protein
VRGEGALEGLHPASERIWDNAHPRPLTWRKRQELEAECNRTCVPVDRS